MHGFHNPIPSTSNTNNNRLHLNAADPVVEAQNAWHHIEIDEPMIPAQVPLEPIVIQRGPLPELPADELYDVPLNNQESDAEVEYENEVAEVAAPNQVRGRQRRHQNEEAFGLK